MITVDAHGRFDRDLVLREIEQLQTLARDLRRLLDGTPATLCADAPMIDCWQPALRHEPCLAGYVTGHQLGIGCSDRVTVTSGLWNLDTRRGCARTLSRWYRLGHERPGRDH